ncbi:DUF1302 family protein [Desulfosarcina variabilis]|uniref:DUF1302 family protein n=1 Tax=Desulfosarcina variabilis TaxID=2300 RepID=UPI003AFA0914
MLRHVVLRWRLWVLVAGVFFCFLHTDGRPGWGSDDFLDGFDDIGPAEEDVPIDGFDDSTMPVDPHDLASETTNADSPGRLGGHAKAAAIYNFAHDRPAAGETDWRGLSSLKTELFLEFDAKLEDGWQVYASCRADYDFAYPINGRDAYTDAVLDAYESEVDVREMYLMGSPARQWDIKVGRQIVVWGTSDNIRVVDVINPLDLRMPGITDIEDLRLPVTLSKLDYYWGAFNLSGILIHEVRFNENPPYGSDFYPFAAPSPAEKRVNSNMRNTQFAMALNGIFSGWDLGIYLADVYDKDAHVECCSSAPSNSLQSAHARIKMVGTSTNVAMGNWLIKGEIAWLDGLKFTNAPNETFSRLDTMAGLEYNGFDETLISLELVDRHLYHHNDDLKQDPDGWNTDQLQWVARMDKDYLNDTLTLTLVLSFYGETGQDGAYQRLSAEYEIIDALTVDGGGVLYQSGNLPAFKNIGDNDRLFLEFKYSF